MDRRSWLNSGWLERIGLSILCLGFVLVDGCANDAGRRYERRIRPSSARDAGMDDTRVDDAGESDVIGEFAMGDDEPMIEGGALAGAQPPVRVNLDSPGIDVAAGAGDDAARSRRILELLNDKSGRALEIDELLKDAENHLENAEPLQAQEKLDIAQRLDPANQRVQMLLARVQTELGDRRGEIPQVISDLDAEQNALKGQTVAEVNILLTEGGRLEDAEEYEKAIERYESAIEIIRNFPFNMQLGDRLRHAQRRLAAAKQRNEDKKLEERREFEKRIEEMREAEREKSLVFEKNRLAELRLKARDAFSRADYETAISSASRILESFPEDLESRELIRLSRERKDINRRQKIFKDTVENYRLALLGIAESSIVYQDIFRYPPREEWKRIAARATSSLQDVIAQEESEVDKEIRRKLALPTDVGFPEPVPFDEAIALLRQMSGLNIILDKNAQDTVESEALEVQLAQVNDLPLENVLKLIFDKAGASFALQIRDSAVIIKSTDSVEEDLILHFYDVHDITQSHPDFPAPDLALDETEGQDTGGGGFFDAGFEDEETRGGVGSEVLEELVSKQLIGVDEEQIGSVRFQRGKLAVRTSLEKHEAVQKLLNKLRQTTGVMVSVESRFLNIQDNFLEEVGIDIGNGNNTFLLNSIPDIDGSGTSVSPGYEFLNTQEDVNVRAATIGQFSNPLGSQVNPFNLTPDGGGAYQLNVLTEAYQLEALITGVAKTQEIRRLSSPSVTAFNTQIAHTMVIDQAAYIKDLEVNQTGVIPVINPVIGVLNTGSILEVRPNVSHDRKYVVLEIQPTLAEQLDSELALLNLSGNFTQVPVELPVTSVTKIKTTVTIPDGGTVLVGGLKREIRSKQSVGIPGLRRVPMLNLLFGRKGDSMLRSNLFVLINAKITIVQEEEEALFNI